MSKLENILNFKNNGENLSTSGQPREDEFKLIADAGFEVIINIRPEFEMIYVFDERNIVSNLGLEYYQIPMTFDTLNNQILTSFFEVMEQNKDKKVLVHCHRNIRVSALILFYRIIVQNWSLDSALTECSHFIEIDSNWLNYFNEHISRFNSLK